ncbi:MAG: hypothetical protein BMS9Abin31_0337 [Gammaproteobacteria bacterium]|nr:MAG: hypothetical protein BMS9Abin31_0337 [Gammaproteobacteria bacterium]
MCNKWIGSHSYRASLIPRVSVLAVLFSLLLSSCSVTPDGGQEKTDNNLTPASTEALSEAVSAMKSGDMKNAQSLLLSLINQQPNIANAHVNLGIVFIKNKSFDEAENSFNRALEINPNNIYALNQLGFLYRRQGDFPRAKASYEKAIDINSDYAFAHLNLGILYDLYLYDLEKAIEQYQIYKELSKDDEKQIEKWIFELERRHKKSLALK